MTDPREAEANGGTATFTFRGETFTVPLEYADLPLGYIEAVGDGKPLAVQARELMGPEQWAKVRAMNLTGRDVTALGEAIDKALGTTEGEDPASSA